MFVFFFKQKTAYEMRISDWSSDVCSSDLPRQKKREARQEAQRHALATFEKVAREWHAHAKDVHEWSEDYSQKILRQLELHAFTRLGRHTIGSLNQLDVLQCLEAISLAGTRETAIRLRESIQRVYARAVTLGLLKPGEDRKSTRLNSSH